MGIGKFGFVPSKKMCAARGENGDSEAPPRFLGLVGGFGWLRSVGVGRGALREPKCEDLKLET
jgi:hypothetical protein